jgi:hypothetical protein
LDLVDTILIQETCSNPIDAEIAGRIGLEGSSETLTDDKISALAGMGGMGILPVLIVYNGWIQNLPNEWKAKLTVEQLNPS